MNADDLSGFSFSIQTFLCTPLIKQRQPSKPLLDSSFATASKPNTVSLVHRLFKNSLTLLSVNFRRHSLFLKHATI